MVQPQRHSEMWRCHAVFPRTVEEYYGKAHANTIAGLGGERRKNCCHPRRVRERSSRARSRGPSAIRQRDLAHEPRDLFLLRARIRSRRALCCCARTVFILQRAAFPQPLGPLDLARALARPCSPGMTEQDWHSLPRLYCGGLLIKYGRPSLIFGLSAQIVGSKPDGRPALNSLVVSPVTPESLPWPTPLPVPLVVVSQYELVTTES